MDCDFWADILNYVMPVVSALIGAIATFIGIQIREAKKRKDEQYRHANFVLSILANQLNKLANIEIKLQEFKEDNVLPHRFC